MKALTAAILVALTLTATAAAINPLERDLDYAGIHCATGMMGGLGIVCTTGSLKPTGHTIRFGIRHNLVTVAIYNGYKLANKFQRVEPGGNSNAGYVKDTGNTLWGDGVLCQADPRNQAVSCALATGTGYLVEMSKHNIDVANTNTGQIVFRQTVK